MKKPTIRDIASKAGVSVTTVSLVLNDKPNTISEPTKKKIKTIAENMNYSPNHMAVSLVTKKSHTIGLIVPDISNNFFADLAKSIEQTCSKDGYSVILSNSNNSLKDSGDYVDLLYNRNVDGLIVSFATDNGYDKKEALVRKLNSLDIPLISLDSWIENLACPGVSIDHRKGGYIAAKHLLDQGHERIGCISGRKGNYSSDLRLQGFKDALEEAGVAYHPDDVVEGDYHYESGYEAAKALFKREVSAIFACNDLMAYGVFTAAKEEAMSVPGDLSLIGFDDLFFSSMLSVPLTTIRQSTDMLGKKACELMMGCLSGQTTSQTYVKLEPRLVVRQSTGRHIG